MKPVSTLSNEPAHTSREPRMPLQRFIQSRCTASLNTGSFRPISTSTPTIPSSPHPDWPSSHAGLKPCNSVGVGGRASPASFHTQFGQGAHSPSHLHAPLSSRQQPSHLHTCDEWGGAHRKPRDPRCSSSSSSSGSGGGRLRAADSRLRSNPSLATRQSLQKSTGEWLVTFVRYPRTS